MDAQTEFLCALLDAPDTPSPYLAILDAFNEGQHCMKAVRGRGDLGQTVNHWHREYIEFSAVHGPKHLHANCTLARKLGLAAVAAEFTQGCDPALSLSRLEAIRLGVAALAAAPLNTHAGNAHIKAACAVRDALCDQMERLSRSYRIHHDELCTPLQPLPQECAQAALEVPL